MATLVWNIQLLQHAHHAITSESMRCFVKRLFDVDPMIEIVGTFKLKIIALARQHRVQIPIAARHENELRFRIEQLLAL